MRQTKRCFLLRGGTVFTLLFAVSMAMHTVLNVANSGWYDANLYWDLGKSCGWNVRNIEWEFRGWVLPYIFSMCYQFGIRVGSEYLGYRILSSFCFAFTFTFSFAYVVKILEFDMSDVKTAYAGGVCGILFLIFFRGLIIYTLSDFYAFSLALLSIILLYRILHYDQKIYRKIFESFLLGLCLYATYNIRTIYQFLLIACVRYSFLAVVSTQMATASNDNSNVFCGDICVLYSTIYCKL